MDELAIVKMIGGSSPLAGAIIGAALMFSRVLINAQKPIQNLSTQIEIITVSLTSIRDGLNDMGESIHNLNNTMTKLVVEREHDRRDIEILRGDLKIISGRLDSTQQICRGHHGNAKN